MKAYKKPIVIECWQLNADRKKTRPLFVHQAIEKGDLWCNENNRSYWYCKTLEGTMTGRTGDVLMQGVRGELYFCKKDIFHLTYQIVELDINGEKKSLTDKINQSEGN